ncbi:hypothetical protein SRHO_G00327880 [Serrasalmus rhombeus]
MFVQATASLSQSSEGRSSAISAAETRNSPVLPQLCQDENNGHIYVNAGTPEIRGRLAATGGVSHSHFTTISDILLDSEPDEDPQMLSSPKHPYSPCDEMENLADIIRDFKRENISEHSTLTVVARRRRILHSAITALNKGYFDWHKRPQIEFVGEMADDYDTFPSCEAFHLSQNCKHD